MATFTHNGTEWTITADTDGDRLTLHAASDGAPVEFFSCPAYDAQQYPETILQFAAGNLFAAAGIDPDAATQEVWEAAERAAKEAMADESGEPDDDDAMGEDGRGRSGL